MSNSETDKNGECADPSESESSLKETAALVLDELISEVAARFDDSNNNESVTLPSSRGSEAEGLEALEDILKIFNNNGVGFKPEDFEGKRGFEDHDPSAFAGDPNEFSFASGCRKEVAVQTEANRWKLPISRKGEEEGGISETEEIDAEHALVLIQILVNDNKTLRKQVTVTENVLRFVMLKYRKSVTFLLHELEKSREIFPKFSSALKETSKKGCAKLDELELEMKAVMTHAIKLDDQVYNQHEEMLAQLRYENQELRKLLKIASDVDVSHSVSTDDKAIQTAEEPRCNGNGETDNEVSDDDIYSLASEDSFHTAEDQRSPVGSFSSVFLETADDDFKFERFENAETRCNLLDQTIFGGSGDSSLQN